MGRCIRLQQLRKWNCERAAKVARSFSKALKFVLNGRIPLCKINRLERPTDPLKGNRVDSNQAEIVEFLRKQGAGVVLMQNAKNGFPDLVVFYQGQVLLVEIKTETGKLTKAQKEFFRLYGDYCHIIRSTKQAKELLQNVAKSK